MSALTIALALLFAILVTGAIIYGLDCRRSYRAGYRLGLERARQCALHHAPPVSCGEQRAYDDVYRCISTLIEEDKP